MQIKTICLSLLLATQLYAQEKNLKITSVPAIESKTFEAKYNYVVGPDKIARHCPDQKNVNTFVQVLTSTKGMKDDLTLHPIMGSGGALLISKPGQGFLIACLVVE